MLPDRRYFKSQQSGQVDRGVRQARLLVSR
jgi:hypothetical protein